VAFFRGTSLSPLPPGDSKTKDARYLDIHENDQVDPELLARWIRPASELPGWVPERGRSLGSGNCRTGAIEPVLARRLRRHPTDAGGTGTDNVQPYGCRYS
jgi:hypothetical protein